jgi:hypothetical protein
MKVKDFALGADATLDGDDCYFLSGTTEGQKINVWITKKDFFIKRKQFVLSSRPGSSMQGTITESYQKILADKPLRKEDYIQSIPKGVRFFD